MNFFFFYLTIYKLGHVLICNVRGLIGIIQLILNLIKIKTIFRRDKHSYMHGYVCVYVDVNIYGCICICVQ